MKYVKFVVRVILLAAVAAAFFGGPYCWLALKTQRLACGLVATLLLGRFFCDAMCPLGIVQSFVNWLTHPKTHVRRVCSRLPETRAQRIVRWSVLAVCLALGAVGCMGVASMVFPISIFGKAMTLWIPGIVLFAVVVVLAAVGDGRIWCNWICPFGTLYNLVAKVSPCKNKIGQGCANCRKCFAAAKDGAPRQDKADEAGVTRRETIKGVAMLAAADKLTDGGYADVSLPGTPARGAAVLPPGAVSAQAFSLKCVGCQLCVASCPGGCLKPSTSLRTFGQPEMDFRHGYCLASCVRCSEVCPEGAIAFLQREQRPNVHMGHAVVDHALCVRKTNGDPCTACSRKCPVQAIHIVKGFPVVDRDTCIGCGACEHVCPARPMPAIYVKGFEMQKRVNPMSEADLVAEMKARIAAGAAVVVAVGGVIVAVEEGRGIGPLVKLLDAQKLRDAIVVDKVIGRAAAAVCIRGGAKKVFAQLADKGVAEMMSANGIAFEAEKTVDVIMNRDQTDSCPMEKAVRDLTDPDKMIDAIRKVMKK